MSVFALLSDPGITTAAGTLAIVAGVWLLRSSWLANSETKPRSVAVSLLLILCGLLVFTQALDAEVGIAYGLLTFSLAGYAIVSATIELRGQKNRSALAAALEPEVRRTNWPRAVAKSLLSIVLAGIAASGVGVAFAVAMPMATHDRIVIGGLLVPVLWGAGMAWTLADARLVRATALLGGISAIGYGIAFLPKVLS